MSTIRKRIKARIAAMGERGSALLVTLMVMVGLSLLGLGFVAISETESAIASNERNGVQTLAVAEAGAKAVVEWFQDPLWASGQGLMPANDPICATTPCIKARRRLGLTPTTTSYTYDNYYKPNVGQLLFDKSYRVNDGKFFGTEDNPDILINDKTAPTFLTGFNIQLFNITVPAVLPAGITSATACNGCDNTQGGRVTEIRIYAPPTDGGIKNTAGGGWTTTAGLPASSGFVSGGSRFGIATIRVTAMKYATPQCGPYRAGCNPVAQRTVKFAISEWPVPGPGGPVQSASNLTNAGNVNIHWGRSSSDQNLSLTKSQGAIPWHDAYNIANVERGTDANVWPLLPADPDYKKRFNWRNELIGRTFIDPWWGARARGTVAQLAVPGSPHPQTWDGLSVVIDPTTGSPAQSNLFQLQTKSDGGDYREVLFPRIDYNYWKQVALAASDQGNVKYLAYDSASGNFKDKTGCVQSFLSWVDSNAVSACNGGKAPAGFYFFDTTNGQNPQNTVNPSNLTPQIQISGGTFQMKGFIYLNASDFKTTGSAGVSGYYNMPGETYRDVGYRKVEIDSSKVWYKHGARPDPAVACTWDATGAGCMMEGAGNGQWDFQDLPWSNLSAATTGDGKFNVYLAKDPAAIIRNSPTTPITANSEYFIVPFTDNCVPGDNSCATCNCSEPHEPYLNFVYPSLASGSTTVRWENPAAQTRQPKKLNAAGTAPVTCSAASLDTDCTSNGYDKDGAMVNLIPVLDGIFYMEGTNSSTGNSTYFGSLLIKNTFDNKGTPDVWFDEKLVKGDWPPKSFNFPRVYVSSELTDQ